MSDKREIIKTVRKFLFSSVNKEFLTFLFFLALSAIFWFMMALNETYERSVDITLNIRNIPKNVVLTSDSSSTVKVTLNDKGFVLLGYIYGNDNKAIDVNFSTYATKSESGSIPATDIQHLVGRLLPISTKITSIKPEEIVFFFNHGASKRVPAKWIGDVKPRQPYFISSVNITPDSIDIYASDHLLDSISAVSTTPISRSDFNGELTLACPLQKINGMKTIPDSISITFTTDILTEESIGGIAIRSINVPQGKVLRTFPSKVTVRFVTGMSRLKTLKPSDFVVVADYLEVADKRSDKCTIRLKSVPKDVSRASLDITKADYLIEE